MADNEQNDNRAASENVATAAKETPHDVPTVRIKDPGGDGYKIINRRDFKADEHELIKGGEDQEQSAMAPGGRNPSGTFSEPTPTDIRFPNKDATEFENNHGAYVRKSAAQMREDHGLEDAPGGLYPAGAFRVEPINANEHRIMSGDREVMRGVSNRNAENFGKMSDDEKMQWMKDRGANPPDLNAERDKREAAKRDPRREPGTHAPGEGASAAAPGGQPGQRANVSPRQPAIRAGQTAPPSGNKPQP